MPVPWPRGVQDSVEYVVVQRDGARDDGAATAVEPQEPIESLLRRQDSGDDNKKPTTTTRPPGHTLATPVAMAPPFLITMGVTQVRPTASALAANNAPLETVVVALEPGESRGREEKISQTTEHLLIAAGSIGATIILVMIILALYNMRKRGLSISDVVKMGQNKIRRRSGPPPPPKYGYDSKQMYADDNLYVGNGKEMYPPQSAAKGSRSGSLSTQTPVQPLGRSESFNLTALDRKKSVAGKSFLLDDVPSRQNSHRRDISATPSSPLLPIQDMRRSASTRNTRSLNGDEEPLQYSDPPQQQPQPPAPPTFRQFLSNRPSASQRPGFGVPMNSRFSWTNSNAPQTPHDPSRDTVSQPVLGRDSFMTQRSSVPRFRTIDSWVNQQSNRVEERKLKQQFRMTQSSTSSGEGDFDEVPEMPTMSRIRESSGLAGKDIKHTRHDTRTTIDTVFRHHPGTEVRFSTRSTVPSEVLDMGRKNAAL